MVAIRAVAFTVPFRNPELGPSILASFQAEEAQVAVPPRSDGNFRVSSKKAGFRRYRGL